MSCPYFKSKYDIGVCSASSDTHIPGIDEMGCLCFKDDFHACSIYRSFVEINPLNNGGDNIHHGHHLTTSI